MTIREHGPWTTAVSRQWWKRQQERRPLLHKAEDRECRINPALAESFGPARSAVLRPGVRTYAFETREARDAFCKMTGATSL